MALLAKIMIGVFGGAFGIYGIFVIILKLKKKVQKKENQKQSATQVEVEVDEEAGLEKQTVERFIEHILEEKPARFSSQLLEIFTSNYSTKLGEGAYGAVYKGHFSDGKPIAVKLLNNYGIDKRIEEQFMAEVNTIGRTYHWNLVRFYGFCFE